MNARFATSRSTDARKAAIALTLSTTILAAGVGFATAAEIESKFLDNVRQLTDGFAKAGEGYFSPDGGTIIYQAVPREYMFYQIYTQGLEDRALRRISPGRGRTTCAYFAPNGEKVIYASSHLDPQLSATEDAERKQQAEDAESGRHRRYNWDFDPYFEIFEANTDGSEPKQLTDSPGYDAEGSYSPDGSKIVFCSTRDGDPDLYIMNADGSDVRQLTDSPGYDGGPFFSPDGQWIVFRSDRKKESFLQIYVIRADGSDETALTDNEGVNWAPYWHPTEPLIIWAGADHSNPRARPNYDLWMSRYEISDDGFVAGEPVRVTDDEAADVLPVFSPDGKQLMWTSTRTDDHSSQLWIGDFHAEE